MLISLYLDNRLYICSSGIRSTVCLNRSSTECENWWINTPSHRGWINYTKIYLHWKHRSRYWCLDQYLLALTSILCLCHINWGEWMFFLPSTWPYKPLGIFFCCMTLWQRFPYFFQPIWFCQSWDNGGQSFYRQTESRILWLHIWTGFDLYPVLIWASYPK